MPGLFPELLRQPHGGAIDHATVNRCGATAGCLSFLVSLYDAAGAFDVCGRR
jgi:hypothetical protein